MQGDDQADGELPRSVGALQVRLLGPVDVVDGDGLALAVGGPKERLVLAALSVHAGSAVSEDRLVDALWSDEPPRTAARTLQSYVSRLRRVLAGGDGVAIESVPGGYRLSCPPDCLDVARLDSLVDAARRASGDGNHRRAVDLLAEAEALWRGPALGDLAGEPFAVAEAARLEELRAVVVEERVDAELALGRHRAVVAELDSLTARYPLRERLWAARMLALYRCGRQADALRTYQVLRRHLDDELGIEPTPEVAGLEQAILLHSPTLDAPVAEGAEHRSTAPHLPSGVVTFLLTDVEGSSQLWEQDVTAMDRAMAAHDRLVADAVAAHDGVLLKQRGEGDSTFSVFWRATDAAAAAIAVERRLADDGDAQRLRVRMAIHTGEAIERGGDYFGPAVNRAARVRAIAAGGEILVSRAAAAVLDGHGGTAWHLVELGRRQLRDLVTPESIWSLRAGSPPDDDGGGPPGHGPELPRFLAAPGSAPLVGRDDELACVLSAGRRAGGGGCVVVTVSGEPGVGKTRLVAEAARLLRDDAAVVLGGVCAPDSVVPYEPFTKALAAVDARSFGALGRHRRHLARLLPDLGEPAPLTDAASDRWSLFESVVAALQALAGDALMVLVVDDLHWADNGTLALLQHLVRAGSASRFLVVLTYREQELRRTSPFATGLAELRRDATIERVTLHGLDADSTASLARTLDAGLDAEVLARVHHETGGNPFFVEEVVAHARTDRRIPESVQAVVGARLSLLGADTNTTLRAAAVVGTELSLREVTASAGRPEDEVLAHLEAAVEARLLVESRTPASYAFRHALVREVLLAELSSTGRAMHHRRVAERLASEREPDVAAVAHHYLAAAPLGVLTDAVTWCRKAADEAVAQFASTDAADVLGRLAEVVEALAPDDTALRCEVATVRAVVLRMAARNAEAAETGDEAVRLARALGDPHVFGRAVEARVEAEAQMFAPADAMEALLREALEALPESGSPVADRLRALLGFQCWFGGRVTAGREAIAPLLDGGDHDLGAVGSALELSLILSPGPWDDDALERSRASQAAQEAAPAFSAFDNGLMSRGFEVLWARANGDGELARDVNARIHAEVLARPTPVMLWVDAMHATAEALNHATMDEAEAALVREQEMGQAGAASDWLVQWGIHLVAVRREQDRMAEALPVLEAQASLPEVRAGRIAWLAGLAWGRASVGDDAAANDTLDQLADLGFAFEEDITYSAMLGLAGEAAHLLGRADVVPVLDDRLARYAGRGLVIGASETLGAADRVRALLAALAARIDDAEASFRSGLEFNQRLQSPRWIAWTQLQWAQMLRREGIDGARSRRLAADALDVAETHGLALVARLARELLDRA